LVAGALTSEEQNEGSIHGKARDPYQGRRSGSKSGGSSLQGSRVEEMEDEWKGRGELLSSRAGGWRRGGKEPCAETRGKKGKMPRCSDLDWLGRVPGVHENFFFLHLIFLFKKNPKPLFLFSILPF
jgi:hypothetical protein